MLSPALAEPGLAGADTVFATDTPLTHPWPPPRPRAPDPPDPDPAADHAARLATVGRLVTAVAHDVNNVLAVVCGHAELLADALPPGSAARESAEVIRAAAAHAVGVSRRLLAHARPADACPVPLDLGDTLLGLGGLIRAVAGGGVRVVLRPGRDPAPVTADPTLVEQVVLNLVANARDAMPAGGTLGVRAGVVVVRPGRDGWPASRPPGRYACLTVSDTGTGIDGETAARLFDPFFTTKRPAGTGIGLATVRDGVARLGGHVEVDSEPGRGTVFRVYLPTTPVAPAPPAAEEGGRDTADAEPGWVPVGSVLLVDDDPGVRGVARAVLEAAGYDVIEAASGDGAARLAHAIPTAIDVLVTDVVLPGLTGRRLAAKLRAERPGLGVVFVSGYAQPGGGDGAGTAFVAKPFRPADLLAAVRRVVGAGV